MTTHTYNDQRDISDVEDMRSAQVEALKRKLNELEALTTDERVIALRAENLQLRIELDREKHRGETWIKSLVDQLAEANCKRVELEKRFDEMVERS